MSLVSTVKQKVAAAFSRTPNSAEEKLSALGKLLWSEAQTAKNDRRTQELIWLEDLRAYKGRYDPDVLKHLEKGRSEIFFRKTKVKTDTIIARVMDILFPRSNERNWEITPTPEPTLDSQAKLAASQLAQQSGASLADATTQIAKQRAAAMMAAMDDQLAEGPDHVAYRAIVRKVIVSGCRYGTGILKGPLVRREERKSWKPKPVPAADETGSPTEEQWVLETSPAERVPYFREVSIWNFYPDMTAKDLRSCRYVYEEYLMLRNEVQELADQASFFGDVIRDYLDTVRDGDAKEYYWEQQQRQIGEKNNLTVLRNRYRVLERWGWLRGDELESAGVDMTDKDTSENYWCNVWMLGGKVIKAVLAPIRGVEFPYYLWRIETDESGLFGDGIPRIMRDPQRALNASVRAMLDNAGTSAGPITGINRAALASDEDGKDIHAFREIFFDTSDDLKNALMFWQVQPNTQNFLAMIKLFDDFGDELTTPRWVHGDGNVADAAKTASGMSMLMGALSINLTELIKGFDDDVTSLFIRALFHWNMDFNPRPDIKGDFNVVARGATVLVAKEVRAQALNQFAALTADQRFSSLVDNQILLTELASNLEIPKGIVLTEDQIRQRQAEQATMAAQANIQAIMAEMQKRGIDPSQALAVMLRQAAAQPGAAAPDTSPVPAALPATPAAIPAQPQPSGPAQSGPGLTAS